MRYNKKIIIAARVMSLLFTPFFLPTLGLLALFSLSYLSLLPFMYKTVVIAIISSPYSCPPCSSTYTAVTNAGHQKS